MSIRTRVNRPTTATPARVKRERMLHQSTNIATVMTPDGPQTVKMKGVTYRRPK